MTLLNLRQAEEAVEDLLRLVDSGQNFTEADLRDIFERTSVAYDQGISPSIHALYSGWVDSAETLHSGAAVSQLAAENPGAVGSIEMTQAGQLAERPATKAALTHLFGGPNTSAAKAFMEASGVDNPASPGVFEDISQRYASEISGEVVTVTPNAKETRIFSATEVPALLDNPDVTSVNGIDIGILRHMRDVRTASTTADIRCESLTCFSMRKGSGGKFSLSLKKVGTLCFCIVLLLAVCQSPSIAQTDKNGPTDMRATDKCGGVYDEIEDVIAQVEETFEARGRMPREEIENRIKHGVEGVWEPECLPRLYDAIGLDKVRSTSSGSNVVLEGRLIDITLSFDDQNRLLSIRLINK